MHDDDLDPTVPSGDSPPFEPTATPAHKSLDGTSVGGFRVRGLLGRGGMGNVYLAEQDLGAGKKLVALKTIQAKGAAHDLSTRRFQEEAFSAATLKTGYVAQVMDYGVVSSPVDGEPLHYLVMEYCSGGTLNDYMKSFPDGRLPVDEVIRLLRQAAEGFLAAERRVGANGDPDPLVHRDIKPANLLLQQLDGTERYDLRIADFGAVKRQGRRHPTGMSNLELSQTGAPMTPGYASPEQWNYEDADHRSDMYSLGATFYHVLTGQRATPDSRELAILRKFVMQSPCLSPRAVREDVPERLSRVIEKMTALRPMDRYQSFQDVVDDLRAFDEQPVSLTKAWILGGVAVAALVAAVFFWLDTDTYSARDLLKEFVKLEQQIREAETRAKDIRLESLFPQLEGLGDRVRTNQGDLRELLAKRDSEATVDLEQWERKFDVKTKLDQLAVLLTSAEAADKELAELEERYEKMSRADALASLAEVGNVDVEELRTRRSRLEESVRGLFQQREDKINALARTFSAGEAPSASEEGSEVGVAEASLRGAARDYLEELREFQRRLGKHKDKFGAIEPKVLLPRIQDLEEALRRAVDLNGLVPKWSKEGSADQQLRDLVKHLGELGQIQPPPSDDTKQWWRQRLKALSDEWFPRVEGSLAAVKNGLNEDREELNAAAEEGQRRTLLDEKIKRWQEVEKLFQSLKGALASKGASVVFGNRSAELVTAADAGQRPTLELDVAGLKLSYQQVSRSAVAFIENVPKLAPKKSDLVTELESIKKDADEAIDDLNKETAAKVANWTRTRAPKLWSSLRRQVDNCLKSCEDDLADGCSPSSVDEEALEALMNVLNGGGVPNDWSDLHDRAVAHRDAVRKACAVVDGVALGSPIDLSEEHVKQFRGVLNKLKDLPQKVSGSPKLAKWCEAWRKKRLQALVTNLQKKLDDPLGDLEGILQTLNTLVETVRQIDAASGESLGKTLERAIMRLQEGPAPTKPETWSEDAWELWPKSVEVPNGLKSERRDDRLVCWFDFRRKAMTEGVSVPVEMLLVKDGVQAPFLVDVHEVCVGELKALGVSSQQDPGGYLKWRPSQWRKIKDQPDALISWTSHQMARAFAKQAYAAKDQAFALPTQKQWSALSSGPDRPVKPINVKPINKAAEVRVRDLDKWNGILGMRSGLAEWLAEGGHQGATVYEQAGLVKNKTWKKGVGFRCVMNLK